MRILLSQQFYPLHGFTRDFRFERLPERSFKRITMLHAEPSGEHPAEYRDEAKQHSAADDPRQVRHDDLLGEVGMLLHGLAPNFDLAQLLDLASERAVLGGHIAFNVGEAAVDVS